MRISERSQDALGSRRVFDRGMGHTLKMVPFDIASEWHDHPGVVYIVSGCSTKAEVLSIDAYR
jgi:hypothetical protein